MASQSVTHSESIAAFIPALELLITEAMDEWKIPGLAIAVVQNGEVALVRASCGTPLRPLTNSACRQPRPPAKRWGSRSSRYRRAPLRISTGR